jgi:hypothetical protein
MEDFIAAIIIGLALAGFFTVVAQLIESSDHDSCHERGELARVQVTYRKWDGCYVNQNGLWMPYEIWKYNRDNGFVQK